MPVSADALSSYARTLRIESNFAALQVLARAIAANFTDQTQVLAVVAREFGSPSLALFGFFDESTRDLLRKQVRLLESACRALDYWDQTRVEQACATLADRLTREIEPGDLARAHFVAIPRGGSVVLDLLSSFLALKPEQLEADSGGETDRPLVIVDDCALSGVRFKQFLNSFRYRQVIFVTLCSTPELRATILKKESQVQSCLAAEDLPKMRGGLDPEDLAQCEARVLKEDCYWLGATLPLCFPWSEPDRLLWDPSTERWVRAWRIVPHELCSKNRSLHPTSHPAVQIQPGPVDGPLQVTDQILWAEIDEDVALCNLSNRRVFRLQGIGADLWRGLLRTGDLTQTVASLQEEYAAPAEILAADAGDLVEDLLGQGFLVERVA